MEDILHLELELLISHLQVIGSNLVKSIKGWIVDNGKIYTTWANDTYYSWTSTSNLEENSNGKTPFIIKYQKDKVIIQSSDTLSNNSPSTSPYRPPYSF